MIPQKLFSIGQRSKCPICENSRGARAKDPLVFEEELKLKYPDLILIDRYTTSATYLKVKSTRCLHSWSILPNSILSKGTGSTCPECEVQSKLRSLTEIKTLLTPMGLELVGEYLGSNETTIVKGICGHSWSVHLNVLFNRGIGRRCKECYKSDLLEDLKGEAFKDGIEITSTEYEGTRGYVQLECKNGHTWSTLVGNLKYYGTGSSCTKCNLTGVSVKELALRKYIESIYFGWVEYSDRTIIRPQELDIVLPNLGLAFEFNGSYWHSETFKDKFYHLNKYNEVKEFGYQLIQINEDEWDTKQEIVKSRILSLIGLGDRVYARNTICKEIPYPKSFLMSNHIQGHGLGSSSNYGLFMGDKLLSVMTFSKPRFNSGYDYELIRYCSELNTTVVGGASKLLNAFRKAHPGKSIISYSDKRWSNGGVYMRLGFKLLNTSPPNYRYYKGTKNLSRYQCQKHLLKNMFPDLWKEKLTEPEIMSLAGYVRVFDCGNDVWVLE